jgi:hypothetical protein
MVAQRRLGRPDRLRDVTPGPSPLGPEDDEASFVEAPIAIAAARRLGEGIEAGHRPECDGKIRNYVANTPRPKRL